MKAVIINCFDTYANRANLVREVMIENGYDVVVVTSDYQHIKKEYISAKEKEVEYIHVKEYKKNLSFARLKSHYCFAKDALNKVKQIAPDLLYVLIPANSLARQVKKYKQDNSNVKVIFDINDLWPETMPIGFVKRIFPFTIWKNFRDKNLDCAEYIVTECNLFKEKLKKVINVDKCSTIYMPSLGDKVNYSSCVKVSDDNINLCYLGSVNNIIDIECICEIIKSIDKNVNFHIIGDGCNVQKLITDSEMAGAKVIYHGLVYDDEKKREILSECHFGLNIMKTTVCVGLTMKSVEYFRYGLPIINNIKGDTWELVNIERIGINYKNNGKNNIIRYNDTFKASVFRVYDLYFSKEKIKREFCKVLNNINNK